MVLGIFTLLGALGMFLYGMNMMSNGLQKAAGAGLRNFLSSITSNPLKGVATGLGVTAVIQSSSATTVMVVGFVNAGILTLTQAIGVIMGANIGTTMTAWIVAIFGFKADISILAVPLMLVGFVMSVLKNSKWRNLSEVIVGFSLLFLGLSFMKNSVPDLSSNPDALDFLRNWSGMGTWSVLIFIVVGTLLTLILQSSSATMALTLIFLNLKWIDFNMAAAMVLGENIGTTITANIAAAIGNPNAKRTALAHTIFNLFGVIWAVIFFKYFLELINLIIDGIGLSKSTSAPLYKVSMLHTIFNLVNTAILIWFIPLIEKIVRSLIKDKPEASTSKLVYINAGLLPTPELAMIEASKEVIHFGEIMNKGLSYIQSALDNSATKEAFEPWREKLVKYEEISDRIEFEVITFLNQLNRNGLSEKTTMQIKSIYRIVKELESLGDSGESISRIIARAIEHKQNMTEEHRKGLNEMISLLGEAYTAMVNNLKNSATITDIYNALEAEVNINAKRDALRDKELMSVGNSDNNYFDGVFYLTLLEELEKMGDHIINISQATISWKYAGVDASWED